MKVVDSRPIQGERIIYRRYHCPMGCKHTSYEIWGDDSHHMIYEKYAELETITKELAQRNALLRESAIELLHQLALGDRINETAKNLLQQAEVARASYSGTPTGVFPASVVRAELHLASSNGNGTFILHDTDTGSEAGASGSP